MSDENDILNTMAMDKIIKALNDDGMPTAKVGVLGDKTNRTGVGDNNATIGAKHEFGEDGMPIRSFLRMPVTTKMQSYLENSGAFDKEALLKVIREGTVLPWVMKIAVIAERIVQDAFDSGGFGQWKPSDMSKKKNHKTLVETNQLRKSISSEVK